MWTQHLNEAVSLRLDCDLKLIRCDLVHHEKHFPGTHINQNIEVCNIFDQRLQERRFSLLNSEFYIYINNLCSHLDQSKQTEDSSAQCVCEAKKVWIQTAPTAKGENHNKWDKWSKKQRYKRSGRRVHEQMKERRGGGNQVSLSFCWIREVTDFLMTGHLLTPDYAHTLTGRQDV